MGIGHPELAFPLLGGVLWGIVNVYLLRRLSEHVRPDRTRKPALIAFDLLLKLAMYALAFLLLWGRPAAQILTAGAGFTLVLLAMFLRSLGHVFVRGSEGSRVAGG